MATEFESVTNFPSETRFTSANPRPNVASGLTVFNVRAASPSRWSARETQLLHRVVEAAGQRAVPNSDILGCDVQATDGRAACTISVMRRAVAVERAAHRAGQSLLQVVEPLLLLRQSHSWMRELQPLAYVRRSGMRWCEVHAARKQASRCSSSSRRCAC